MKPSVRIYIISKRKFKSVIESKGNKHGNMKSFDRANINRAILPGTIGENNKPFRIIQ